jgi:hypothetical protein
MYMAAVIRCRNCPAQNHFGVPKACSGCNENRGTRPAAAYLWRQQINNIRVLLENDGRIADSASKKVCRKATQVPSGTNHTKPAAKLKVYLPFPAQS